MIRFSKFSLGVLGLFLLVVSLGSLPNESDYINEMPLPSQTPLPATPVSTEPPRGINDLPFQDNRAVYQYDDPGSVVVMYVTVRKGNAQENTNYTWAEVNRFDKWINGSKSADLIVGRAEAIVQFGDEGGPLPGELGYGAVVPNATIQIRGASSSSNGNPQKSYKIELNEDAGEWRGQTTLALLKHLDDLTRVRNKLNFDLMIQMPNMISLRTQFVHLYVKDQTIEPWGTKFVDYGLYTQIEQVNTRFLKNRRLDPNSQLYKATNFEFYVHDELLHTVDDPLYNEEAFSNRLEIKGNRDHSKFIRMLKDINNTEILIKRSFEIHFDKENYFTWLAYNILVGNIDTQVQNFYLYSPQNAIKWYFIPWDYDGSLKRQERADLLDYPDLYYETGIANYWGSVLHNRVLRMGEYRTYLDEKIHELLKLLTPVKIQNMLDIYWPVVDTYVKSPPDISYLPYSRGQFDSQYAKLPAEIQVNYELYLDTNERPMPFWLDTPRVKDDKMVFNWDEAFNFVPQDVTYHIEISKDVNFNNILYENFVVNIVTDEIPIPEPGTYFWRVIATNAAGKVQHSMEDYWDADGRRRDGMRSFILTPDGGVIVE